MKACDVKISLSGFVSDPSISQAKRCKTLLSRLPNVILEQQAGCILNTLERGEFVRIARKPKSLDIISLLYKRIDKIKLQ